METEKGPLPEDEVCFLLLKISWDYACTEYSHVSRICTVEPPCR